MNFLAKIFGGVSPFREVADVVDRFVETKEEKREFFKEIYQMESTGRENARNLYGQDSNVQKVFALVFLTAYVVLTGFMLYWAFHGEGMDLTDFQITMISTTFGAMSAKVSTITDFFFGSAQHNEKLKIK